MRSMQLALVLGLLIGIGIITTRSSTVPEAPKKTMQLGVSPGGTILALDEDALDADLERATALGINEIRLDFDWSKLEREPGEYSWSTTDRIVEAANSHDIAIHALVTYTPSWARPPSTSDKHPPSDLNDFGTFVRAAVQRYSSQGIRSWEIWNEPNVDSFWSEPNGPDPETFAALVSAASEAIRATDPDALVISGGLAPAVDVPGEEVAPETFLEAFLSHIEPGTIDAVGVHPYSYPAAPDDRSKSWNLFGRLPSIHQLASELSDEPMPLWITEFGAPTGDASRSVSERAQARQVEAALGCANQTEWIDALFLYNLRDRTGGDADDIEDNFGLFYSDGTPKESATAVAQFQSAAPGDLVISPCNDW